jgi:two-component system, LytTR family, sensor kinase
MKDESFSAIQWKIIYWLCQILGWGTFFGLIIYIQLQSSNSDKKIILANGLALYFSAILYSHIIRSIVINTGFYYKNLFWVLTRFIPLSLIPAMVLTLEQSVIAKFILNTNVTIEDVFFNTSGYFILYVSWMAIYVAIAYIQHIQAQRTENLKLYAEKHEIELQLLKAQLNPHFVFNSLNSIKALILESPELARESTSRLSHILRVSLGNKNQRIKLEEEITFVENYLELEKIRYENRLRVEWEVNSKYLHKEVLPFSIQLLVENAIKHSVSQKKEGDDILIRIFDKEGLIIEVENNKTNKKSKNVTSGIGINNLKRRLNLEFGPESYFKLEYIENKVVAHIKYKV